MGADETLKEEKTEGNNAERDHKRSRIIRVSGTKKPLFFYLSLAKVCFPLNFFLKSHGDARIHISAIPTVVTIDEILKRSGVATKRRNFVLFMPDIPYFALMLSLPGISTSTVGLSNESKCCWIQKAKISIYALSAPRRMLTRRIERLVSGIDSVVSCSLVGLEAFAQRIYALSR